MTSSLKKKLTFIGAVIVLALAVVIFVFIPTAGGAAARTVSFGEWNGTPVEYTQDSYFLRQVQNIAAQYQNMGMQITDRTYYPIMRQAYQSAILRLAVLDELATARYAPTDREVNRALISQFYSDENGKYSDALYNNTQESVKMSRRKTMTEELTAQRYFYDCLGDQNGMFGLKVSQAEGALLAAMRLPERSFFYVTFTEEDFPESEVVRFGEQNADLFASLNLSMITVDEESEAARIHSMISSGETTFEEAEAAYSARRRTDSSGKILNNMRKDINVLFPDAADLAAVLALGEGEISAPVRSGISYAIVRCDGAETPADFTLSETIAEVRTYMERNERGTIEDYIMTLAEDFSKDAASSGFEEAVTEHGRIQMETNLFSLNFGGSAILPALADNSDAVLSSAARSEEFFRETFSLKEGDVSRPVMLDGGAIVLALNEEDTGDAASDDDGLMDSLFRQMLGYYATEWGFSSIAEMYFASDKFNDRFDATYLRYFVSGGSQ